MYRNECCWLFIENVATDVIIDLEESQLRENEMIGEYFTDLQESKEDLMNLSVYNPPGSMNLNRYSHA